MTLLGVDFELPKFYCPIPSAVHPAVDAIERRAIEWIDGTRLYRTDLDRRRLIGTKSAEFYARFAPFGVEENILVASLWVYWGFSFDDDRCDDGPLSDDPAAFLSMAGRLQHAMECSAVPSDSYSAALNDIMTRMRACATPVQVRRFIAAHRHWLYCVAWQIGNNAARRMPSVGEYLAMRLGSSGGPPTVALLEIAVGAEIPAREMDSRPVRALTDMTYLVAALDNDMHSYRREAEHRYADQNIVSVLMHQEQYALPEAIAAATSIRDRVMVRFLRLRDRTYLGASAELTSYLNCLGHAIRGNIDWAARVPRYLSHGIPTRCTTPVASTATGEPRDSSPDPLPFGEISWWWDADLDL